MTIPWVLFFGLMWRSRWRRVFAGRGYSCRPGWWIWLRVWWWDGDITWDDNIEVFGRLLLEGLNSVLHREASKPTTAHVDDLVAYFQTPIPKIQSETLAISSRFLFSFQRYQAVLNMSSKNYPIKASFQCSSVFKVCILFKYQAFVNL